jgi:hypothetical protein
MPAVLSIPESPRLQPLSQRVYTILARHTAFPWPLMQSQCRRQGVDPERLSSVSLGFVLQGLAMGVARVTDAQSGMRVRRELVELLRQA